MTLSKKITFFSLLLASLTLMGQGCVSLNFGKTKIVDGGMFVSQDKGETWTQKVFAGAVKNKTQTISTANVSKILFHPLDSKVIYINTSNSGVWASVDAGETWKLVSVSTGAIGLDPTSTQIIYLGIGSQIEKSTDGGVTWATVYTQGVSGYAITAVAVDPFNSRQIFAGSSNGVVIKSDDSGASWRTLGNKTFSGPINEIIFHLNDAGVMIVATPASGLFKSSDRGMTWSDLLSPDTVKKFPGSLNAGTLLMGGRASLLMLYSSKYGIMRSRDGGKTWEAVPLLTKPGEVNILSLAANPFDFDEIYFGTGSNFYKTLNGGTEWITRQLPSSRQPTALAINPNDAAKLWMGVTKPAPQKKRSPFMPF